MNAQGYRKLAFALLAVLGSVPAVLSQCTNNNTVIAGGAITPPCPGSIIVPCVNGGQYALVNVTLGNIYEFGTCNATYDTRITLYNNSGGGSIGYSDDACQTQSIVVWTATYTGQLRVLVDRYVSIFNTCAHSGGCAPLSISCYSPAPAVSNNECSGAIDLFVFPTCFSQTFSNVGATNSSTTPSPSCSFTGTARDVWFRFTAPGSGAVVIRTQAFSLGDLVMQLYSGACGSLVRVQCDDDSGPGLTSLIDRRCTNLTPGAVYYLRVWGQGSTTGTFGVCVEGSDVFTTPQQDCSGGFTLCSSGSINNASDFTGCSADLNTTNMGCLGSLEQQGTWYFFSPQSTGDISFNIVPMNALGQPDDVDFDFAVWGPLTAVTCPPPAAPIRCSYALPPSGGPWATGLQSPNTDNSEGSTGNGFLAPLTIGAAQIGRIYMLYVDNFNANGQAFSLSWGLAAPGQLDCTLLPISVIDLNARMEHSSVAVEWTAQHEAPVSHFIVEHSVDGTTFKSIGTIMATSGVAATTDYRFDHVDPVPGLNYYRLTSISDSGSEERTRVVSVLWMDSDDVIRPYPNPAGDMVFVDLSSFEPGSAHTLHLFDASGRDLRTHRFGPEGSSSTVRIPLLGLSAGCYVLSLLDPDGQRLASCRVVKE
ncbi:MAG: T9SS type A sorting domain-containing protein [Flavobacteriales bacterium]|nr:T9SS type A sorting domain-containing protein [Flavobacteriales bacterium]